MLLDNAHNLNNTSGIKWLIYFRTIVILLSLVVLSLSGGSADSFPYVKTPIFLLLAGLFALNVFYYLSLTYFKNKKTLFVMLQMFIDIAAETGLVFLTGGVQSHFAYLFFASIMTGSMLLTRRASAVFACFSTMGLALVTILHLTGTGIDFIPEVYRPINASADNYLARMLSITLAFFLVAFLSGLLQSRLAIVKILNEEILQNMPEGVVVFDNTDRIVFFNEEFLRLFTEENLKPLLGMHISDLFVEKGLDSLVQIIVDGRNYRFEIEKKQDPVKHLPPMEIRVSPVGSAVDKKGVVAIFVDLSMRHRAESAERRAERFEAVGEMAAGLAHEIRNPLASVRGSIQEIANSFSEGSADRKLCEIVINESDRLDSIITEFLQFARIRPLHLENCNVEDILKELSLLLSKNEGYSEVKVFLDVDEGSSLIFKADSRQIREVFMNISINACSAMSAKGTLRINCSSSILPELFNSDGNNTKRGMLVSFADTGSGFKAEDAEKIFQPFYTTKPKGTGLGLSISKKIVDSHNGYIWATSAGEGTGSVFYCWLPYEGPVIMGNTVRKRRTTTFYHDKG
ncbi:MAG: two-component system sensor histidine kinase NtrB [Planctomycetota bacterium]|jgi:two-component system sensor histidine kinase PilS (NtrC family)